MSGRRIHVRMPPARPCRLARAAKRTGTLALALVLLFASLASGEWLVEMLFALPKLVRLIVHFFHLLVRPVLRSPRDMTGPMKACLAVFIGLIAVTALRWFAEDPASDLRLQAAIGCVILAPLGIAVLLADHAP